MIVIDPKTGQTVWRKMPKNWTRRRLQFTPDTERCLDCGEWWTPKTTKGKIKCLCDLRRN
jgi:hypothetical protein